MTLMKISGLSGSSLVAIGEAEMAAALKNSISGRLLLGCWKYVKVVQRAVLSDL